MFALGVSGVQFLVPTLVGSSKCLIVAVRPGLICIDVIQLRDCRSIALFKLFCCCFSFSSEQYSRRCSGVLLWFPHLQERGRSVVGTFDRVQLV